MYTFQQAPGVVVQPGGCDYQPPSQMAPGYGVAAPYAVQEYVSGGICRIGLCSYDYVGIYNSI